LSLVSARDPDTQLDLSREIATTFPYQSPGNYLRWAELALVGGDTEQAKLAIRAGLRVFPASEYPYGEVRMTPELYADWIERAETILELYDASD
jgi:hypothetical protein